MTLGNFMRAQLFSAFSPVKIGMDVMTKQERVQVDSLVGHGGIFATPKVAQKILAAAFNTPIKVMATAAEGGALGHGRARQLPVEHQRESQQPR